MKEPNSYLSSANVKKQGRTAYYKMLESVRRGELIQVRRGYMLISTSSVGT
jgi:hypothetical protein